MVGSTPAFSNTHPNKALPALDLIRTRTETPCNIPRNSVFPAVEYPPSTSSCLLTCIDSPSIYSIKVSRIAMQGHPQWRDTVECWYTICMNLKFSSSGRLLPTVDRQDLPVRPKCHCRSPRMLPALPLIVTCILPVFSHRFMTYYTTWSVI